MTLHPADQIRELIKQLPKDDTGPLWNVVFDLEHHYDCRLIKYDRTDIESQLATLSDGEKQRLSDEEWEEFSSCWSWRHLEEWIIADSHDIWSDELAPFLKPVTQP